MTTRSYAKAWFLSEGVPQQDAASYGRVQNWFVGVLLAWLVLLTVLAGVGVISLLPARLLPIPIAISMALLLVPYTASATFRGYIHALDMRALTLLHVWRIPAALAFLWYGAQGWLPATFTRNAGWGDLAAGILALVVVFGLARVPRWRFGSYVGFHLFGFADFVVAVGTGFAFSLLGDPLMETLRVLPMVLIPLFGVPVTGALHLMTLHRLFTRRG
jgi:hypothetical protein